MRCARLQLGLVFFLLTYRSVLSCHSKHSELGYYCHNAKIWFLWKCAQHIRFYWAKTRVSRDEQSKKKKNGWMLWRNEGIKIGRLFLKIQQTWVLCVRFFFCCFSSFLSALPASFYFAPNALAQDLHRNAKNVGDAKWETDNSANSAAAAIQWHFNNMTTESPCRINWTDSHTHHHTSFFLEALG